MNEHGLAAALTFLLPKTVKPGINGGFLIRVILEKCKTAEEAAWLLQKIPISSVHNIVVADCRGAMFVAECTAEQVSVRWCEKYAAATNHFITPAMQQYNAEDENWYQTRDRLATLESVLVDEHMTFDDIVQGICNEALERKVELNEICNNRYGCFCDFYDIRSDYLF